MNEKENDLKPSTLEPMSDATGLLDEITAQDLCIDVTLYCDQKIRLVFHSNKELEGTKRTLLQYIGRIVRIFVDDHGVPHVCDVASSKNLQNTKEKAS